eukprot:469015-Prorocentrum_minimum.AAC.2
MGRMGKSVLWVFAMGITVGNVDLLYRFLRSESLTKEADSIPFDSTTLSEAHAVSESNRPVVQAQVDHLAPPQGALSSQAVDHLAPPQGALSSIAESTHQPLPSSLPNGSILASLYSEACQRFYDDKVSRDVLKEVKFAGVHEPTGHPLKTPLKIQRALTWEDWALNLTTYRKRKEYNWELPLWVRTRQRSSKIIRLDTDKLQVSIIRVDPFNGLPISPYIQTLKP